MLERDRPQGTADQTPQTLDQGIDEISELLDEPTFREERLRDDLDAHDEENDEPEAASRKDEAGAVVDAEAIGDDETAGGEKPDEDEDNDANEGSQVGDNARVTLDDGTETTVGELKRNTLFQRDYTRKTQELAEQRRTVENQQAELCDYAQALTDERAVLLSAAQAILPQEPDPELMESDPIGYMQAKADFDRKIQAVTGLMQSQQAEQGMLSAQAQQMNHELRATEAQKLIQSMPELNSREAYQQYWSDAVEVMGQEYGFTSDELDGAIDHRLYKAMRDLIRYHRARNNTASVSRELGNSPKLLRGTKRMDPKARTARKKSARAEQLRKTGDFEAGISALMDLDL